MSEEKPEDKKDDKKPDIIVEVDRTPEIEKLTKERDDAQKALKDYAEKEFQKEVDKITEEMKKDGKYSTDEIAQVVSKIQTPEDLSKFKDLANLLMPKPSGTPAGKATIPEPTEKFEDIKQMITDVYKGLADPSTPADERKQLEEKRKRIWEATVKGLRLTYQTHGEIKKLGVATCARCGQFLPVSASECSTCGYKME